MIFLYAWETIAHYNSVGNPSADSFVPINPLETVFGRVDILHVPSTPMPAHTLADSDPNSTEGAARTMALFTKFTRPISYLGLPAISTPCGFADNGLPIGFQLVGRPFAEALLLNAAHMYQRETAWREHAPAL